MSMFLVSYLALPGLFYYGYKYMADGTDDWLSEVFVITKKSTATKWMVARKKTMKGRNTMRESLAARGVYSGSAAAYAMLDLLQMEIDSHEDALLSAVKELLDSSSKPLTKEQDERIIGFCDETFGGVDSVLGPMRLFDDEMKLAHKGQPSSATNAVRQKLKAAKGSAALRLRVNVEKYLYERRQRLETLALSYVSERLPPRDEPNTAERGLAMRSLGVFLCHSSDDKAAVRELYDRLQTDGYQPWLDEKDLLPGQDWEGAIRRAVRETDVVIVCLSCRSITKEGFVQKEIRIALDVADEKPEDTIFLIPARLEECQTPDRFSKWHWVNLFEDDGYHRLIQALQQRAATLTPRAPEAASPQVQNESVSSASRNGDPVVDIRVGSKMHVSAGFIVQALLTNYTDRPVKLDRLELEWWHSSPSHRVRSKEIELNRPLSVNAVDEVVKIRLSDAEAAQGESKYSDLRELYAVLHASISVFYYSKNTLEVAKTGPFKIL